MCRIAPSPRWMRQRLAACGVRPINNIVDITNYIMLEYGQPMHAFDIRHLAGGKIIVRNAEEGEEFVTLDGNTHTLDSSMLAHRGRAKGSSTGRYYGRREFQGSGRCNDHPL